MAWCPICKNEYQEGITKCADCGVELVEQLEACERAKIVFGEEVQMTSLKKFMEYNGLQGVTVCYDETEEVYELAVQKKDQKQAADIARVFLQQRAEEQQETAEEPEEPSAPAMDSQAPYQSSQEKAENNRSAGLILIGVGLVGLSMMLLGMTDVLSFSFGNSYMFYGVMCTVFILFMVMGVFSMKNAKIFAKKAESENSLKETLEKWCRDNLKEEEIDAQLQEESTGEELYFCRCEKLKERLNHQFMNLDQDFLEQFIDTVVYDMVFSQEA
ncbi:MAG: hypothetical protein NC081_10435 [Roseburia sp.]|nr:hypothetical protein [Roseburia sp.]